jgi:hypothetical protein
MEMILQTKLFSKFHLCISFKARLACFKLGIVDNYYFLSIAKLFKLLGLYCKERTQGPWQRSKTSLTNRAIQPCCGFI